MRKLSADRTSFLVAERRESQTADLWRVAVDTLPSHLAILDYSGRILAVNARWQAFAEANGLSASDCGPGANYLEACEQATGPTAKEARLAAEGIREVARGAREQFYLEYAGQSLDEPRRYSVRCQRFQINDETRVLVQHDDITERSSTERRLNDAQRKLAYHTATDGLTGLANRASFDRALECEWKRQDRGRAPLSVILLDIDFFKLFNEMRGHEAGDAALKMLGEALAETLRRPGDLAARYGGEEFAAILPNTDEAGAARIANEIQLQANALVIEHPRSPIARHITVSIGTATIVPTPGESAVQLLASAEAALRAAKANGRDQIVQAPVLSLV
jgi:diguanylate cyclase (GGDEF)-like protein